MYMKKITKKSHNRKSSNIKKTRKNNPLFSGIFLASLILLISLTFLTVFYLAYSNNFLNLKTLAWGYPDACYKTNESQSLAKKLWMNPVSLKIREITWGLTWNSVTEYYLGSKENPFTKEKRTCVADISWVKSQVDGTCARQINQPGYTGMFTCKPINCNRAYGSDPSNNRRTQYVGISCNNFTGGVWTPGVCCYNPPPSPTLMPKKTSLNIPTKKPTAKPTQKVASTYKTPTPTKKPGLSVM
jgi:hypothetical protein